LQIDFAVERRAATVATWGVITAGNDSVPLMPDGDRTGYRAFDFHVAGDPDHLEEILRMLS
jgi:hypothetical protein